MDYWEDRLVKTGQHNVAVAALEAFRRGRKSRAAQNKLYDLLTNLGVTGEEADEIINLELTEQSE